MLASLSGFSLERTWRMMLEGALLEGRIGNVTVAREAFDYLCKNCSQSGQVYLEASKYEEREGNIEYAIDYAEEGIDFNQKYSPLWFQYLRLYEKAPTKLR